ncbi:MAG TPA: biotin/lipoate A/B protein ligase family protein [bacterium]|nr:biotin/lipoate A/B protein ligase family protein [bacterium]
MNETFDAPMNMAIDEALLLKAIDWRSRTPAVRFYDWLRRAVSIGYFQKIAVVRDILKPVQTSFEIVRRMTGGGVVFHGNDITFSIVAPEEAFAGGEGPGKVVESYRKVNEAIRSGISAIREAGSGGPTSLERQAASIRATKLCFAQPTKYDVMYEGRKIAGGAQRRIGGYVLYQGSILMRREPEEELSALLGPTAATMEEIAGRKLDRNEAVRQLRAGFEEAFGRCAPAAIDETVIDQARRLAIERYGCDEWLNAY